MERLDKLRAALTVLLGSQCHVSAWAVVWVDTGERYLVHPHHLLDYLDQHKGHILEVAKCLQFRKQNSSPPEKYQASVILRGTRGLYCSVPAFGYAYNRIKACVAHGHPTICIPELVEDVDTATKLYFDGLLLSEPLSVGVLLCEEFRSMQVGAV